MYRLPSATIPSHLRRGIGLVEILMTIAVIAFLIGLLLPAVQRIRSVADRVKCQSQMKQLMLGMHTYQDQNGRLPPRRGSNGGSATTNGAYLQLAPDGVTGFPVRGNLNRYSTWVYLLPYIGHDTLDQSIKSPHKITHTYFAVPSGDRSTITVVTVPNGPTPWYNGYKPWQTAVAGLFCPADEPPPASGLQQSNYAVNVGDSMYEIDSGSPSFRGPFGAYTGFRTADISDGMSQTIAISERRRPSGTATRDLANNVRNFGPNGAQAGFSPADCWRTVDQASHTYTRLLITGWSGSLDAHSGTRWADGGHSYNAFSTNIAPNGPSCMSGGDGSWGILAANSHHSGGVNVAFLDGSVRFIRDTIDTGPGTTIVSNSAVSSGPSPFGIWGAMGTRNGYETIRD